ncbi:MAG: hypothetical protein SFW67_15040 [Myxococcaceae bacterium]|nr:hypothetical protein [Myxococcaceae bacterium]
MVLVGVVVGAVALGGVLQVAWLRVDELPWLWRDLADRTPMAPPVRAAAEDVTAIEDGMALAFEVAPEVFPLGLEGIDVALYDSDEVLVWTRRSPAGGTPRGQWGAATLVATPVWAQPTERSLRVCRGSEGFANWSRVRAVTRSETFFMCAPMSTFISLQRGRSIYDTRESYLATVVHEFAHQYLALYPEAPVGLQLAARLPGLPSTVSAKDALGEAFATWAELRAAQRKAPRHFERLRTEFAASCAVRPDDVHCLGLAAALELLRAQDAGTN